MSKKIELAVHCSHVLHDDEGRALNPGETHKLAITPLIESYIADGHLVSLATEAEEPEVKEEAKKPAIPNKPKQETAEIQ